MACASREAKREVFGELHEGWAASCLEPRVRRVFLHADDSVAFFCFLFSGVRVCRARPST